jgi:hypothetical protein
VVDPAVVARVVGQRGIHAGSAGSIVSLRSSRIADAVAVDVRSMLWMAGLRVSGLPGALPSPGALPVPRDMADSWELRLWRPLGGPLGSLSWSMAPLQT